MAVNILGIESSCDETAAAIVTDGRRLRANIVASQIDLHRQYGGVVPEIAARSHVEVVTPVIEQALTEAKMDWDDIDGISVTYGPGLSGSLLIGTLTARTLAVIKKKPLYAVNHVEGHVYANWLLDDAPVFPVLALIVSGGHTQLALFEDHVKYRLLRPGTMRSARPLIKPRKSSGYRTRAAPRSPKRR
jgi:N6-L-threonylcarbamoyladenine synthase